MTPALNMRQTAAAIGMGLTTFRRRRRALTRELAFPAPIAEGRPYAWRPEAVEAWLTRRLHAVGSADVANDDRPALAHRAASRLQRARAAAAARMTGTA